jgi:hypothetical protein
VEAARQGPSEVAAAAAAAEMAALGLGAGQEGLAAGQEAPGERSPQLGTHIP